jgi:hypothetical protein
MASDWRSRSHALNTYTPSLSCSLRAFLLPSRVGEGIPDKITAYLCGAFVAKTLPLPVSPSAWSDCTTRFYQVLDKCIPPNVRKMTSHQRARSALVAVCELIARFFGETHGIFRRWRTGPGTSAKINSNSARDSPGSHSRCIEGRTRLVWFFPSQQL